VTAAVGRATRGTTSPNRLRRFDRWINHLAQSPLRSAPGPLVVDLGFGDHPATTLEWQRALRTVNPAVRVVGVEIDPARVEAARGVIDAVRGGFEIPTPERPLLVRAANVLRQYHESEVAAAWKLMSARIVPGGWLVDGTCDERGRVTAMISVDHTGTPRWFTVACRLAGLDRPGVTAARLPKALIHHNVPGTGIHSLLTTMDDCWVRAPRWGARQRWVDMAGRVRDAGWPVRDGPGRWRLGELTVAWEAVG
jgi:hypothetical protein